MVANLADAGVSVPDGFATTADAYRRFLGDDRPGRARSRTSCAASTPTTSARWPRSARQIREPVVEQPFPADLEPTSARRTSSSSADDARRRVLRRALQRDRRGPAGRVVRRAAGDLPQRRAASTRCCRRSGEVFASLYNDRAIAYRVHHGFDHDAVALSAGVQRMVRSDIGASGVMFTMDTESGFDDAVFVTAAYGLGEAVVQGAVNPDEFYVYKPALRGRPARRSSSAAWATRPPRWSTPTTPRSAGRPSSSTSTADERALLSLTDDEVEELARHALRIEEHYGRPDGHRVGQGRRSTASSTSCRPGPRRCSRAGRAHVASGSSCTSSGHGAGRGPRDRAEDRRRRGAGAQPHRRRCTTSPRARCWSPT